MSTSTQTETATPQAIGAHALTRAMEYADRASRYAAHDTAASLRQNEAAIAAFSGLAAVYADVAKAAAALTTIPASHGK
ncbi:hypothetical protein ACIQH0_36200 [Streptomyces griseus]|uniref:hypothetical protein n=1 Tax=Streptomyces griseus TaxID=1911 RepID=UPI0037F3F794